MTLYVACFGLRIFLKFEFKPFTRRALYTKPVRPDLTLMYLFEPVQS